jgi:hypothetical protein
MEIEEERMQETGLGLLGVDWKERIDFAKMRTERVEKAKQALKAAEVDADEHRLLGY